MSSYSNRVQLRKAANSQLDNIWKDANRAIIIHYSCESFYGRPEGASPRITSIAVRNLANAQTKSFSIHQVAERKGVPLDGIKNTYNDHEKVMLDEFYDYVENHKDYCWIHWNMRDINYGFEAIAHRYKVLGGDPEDIPESRLCDLARLLINLFGTGYASHPRLTSLMKLNSISNKDFLTGQEEADAFDQMEYVKLHQSTLRKVDVIANIMGRLREGVLKTNARWKEIHGSSIGYLIEKAKDHPVWSILMLLAALASIISIILQ